VPRRPRRISEVPTTCTSSVPGMLVLESCLLLVFPGIRCFSPFWLSRIRVDVCDGMIFGLARALARRPSRRQEKRRDDGQEDGERGEEMMDDW
jgi:hypothetical protein